LRDFGEGADAAAGADGGAIESGGGTGEFEPAGNWPVFEERVDEGGVENVAGAGVSAVCTLKAGA